MEAKYIIVIAVIAVVLLAAIVYGSNMRQRRSEVINKVYTVFPKEQADVLVDAFNVCVRQYNASVPIVS